MVVKILLSDGTIRTYLVAYGRGWRGSLYRTKCGRLDCEHLECAVDYEQSMVSTWRWLRVLMPFLILCGGGIALFFFAAGPGSQGFDLLLSLVLLSILVLTVGWAALGISVFGKLGDQEQIRLRELEEFRDTGRMKGMPARQLSGEPSPA